MHAAVGAIEYFLPERVVTTADLAAEFPAWAVEKIDAKTGIHDRHVVGPGECASDLAVKAAQKLFDSGACRPEEIDFILLCTQSPDYFLPTTACLLQSRLGIPTSAGAFDFNLGSSGYVYGLGLAEGLISSGQASRILLLTADTFSRFIHHQDKSVRTIFADGAAATLVKAVDAESPLIGPFVYGTDGSGAPHLIVPAGGMRTPQSEETSRAVADESGNVRSANNLFMDGGEIFSFTLKAVPALIQQALHKTGLALDDIDLFVFHQPNLFMLEHLRKLIKIPAEKFCISVSHCGNTVSCTIPIALKDAWSQGRLAASDKVLLVGFGGGYSWAAALVRWHD